MTDKAQKEAQQNLRVLIFSAIIISICTLLSAFGLDNLFVYFLLLVIFVIYSSIVYKRKVQDSN